MRVPSALVFAWAFVAQFASLAMAHPAVGIVIDASGAVFYSDTAQVWRIAPDGSRAVVVPNVHTHSLWLDPDGNLYGEHLAGGSVWTHRIWRRSPNGTVADVIPTRNGFLDDYRDFSLIRDGRGAMYWFDNKPGGGILRRFGTRPVEKVATLNIAESGWMSVLPDGTSILVDHGFLVKVTPDGKVQRLPGQLASVTERYSLMSVWADGHQNLYVAVYSDAAVRKITPDGVLTTVAKSPVPWQPTGGLVSRDEALWILETSPTNQQRVRKIAKDGRVQIF